MQRHGLYRSRTNKVFGGVAGGIARSLNTDPAIVRLIFALMIIVGGGGILLYLILWIAIPEEPFEFFQANEATGAGSPGPSEEGQAAGTPKPYPYYPPRPNNGALIAGLILISIGAIFIIERFLPTINLHLHDFWPLIIVFAGIGLIISSLSKEKKA
jgi:phage shock protein PspC (stress-responsive transcriptional regulator)